jgi:hypothetical protein
LSLLQLREDIFLPDPRLTVSNMARVAHRHPSLKLMNPKAVAGGRMLGATIWLSHESAAGALPGVLDEASVPWKMVRVD